MARYGKQSPWYFLPFIILWRLVGFILSIIGRTFGMILGGFLIFVGMLLCFTIIGAVVGIPVMIVGVMLVIRSLALRK